MAQTGADVVVRRRRSLMGAVGVVSAALAAGYAWRSVIGSDATSLAVAIVLALIAGCFGYAWRDARLPLLVADPTGLRIRLGSAWTGVPWELVETVEVEERGSISDGQVTVVTSSLAEVMTGASRRSRWAARVNRWLYDAPLVVPFGLTTTVSAPDIAASLDGLAAGRARVVVVNGPEPEPDVTVEVSPAKVVEPTPTVTATVMLARAEEAEPPDAVELTPVPAGAPSAADAAPHDVDDPDAAPDLPKPRRKHWMPLAPRRFGGPRTPVGDYLPTPARREDVTIAARTDRATVGSLALAVEPVTTVGESLPEISHLRRTAEPDLAPPDGGESSASNVSLIIDATTDITTRAMQRVRPVQVRAVVSAAPERDAVDVPMPGTVIGGLLTESRMTLGLTIDELADRTRIRPYVIESIEVDDFSPCGGDFYARGHLRMLARVLGIDAEPLIQTYDARFATTPVNARKVFEVELATGSTGMVRGSKSGANWGALGAAVLVLLLVWGVARYVAGGADPVVAPGTSTTHHATGSGPTGATKPSVGAPAESAQVKLTATADTRVRVTDGRHKVVFSGLMASGSTKKLSGRAPLRVHAGDAGSVDLSVRGKSLGPVGDPGGPGGRLVQATTQSSALSPHVPSEQSPR